MKLQDGVTAWAMSSSKYVQAVAQNVKDFIEKTYPGRSLLKHVTAPFPTGYVPKLDVTPKKLNVGHASFYQSQIGVLHWCVELGQIDILMEVSLLSSHLALPREGHLDAVFHLFAYLEKRHNAWIVFDPNYPDINMDSFIEWDC